MKVRSDLHLLLCISFLLISNCLAVTGNRQMLHSTNQERSARSPFRYIIISNEVSNASDNSQNAQRHVGVLLEEKAFSEETLKELFKLVSTRCPQPDRLEVSIYTSLEQLDTPEERDNRVWISGSNGNTSFDNYHRALFIRQNGNELIRHSVSLPVRGLTTIILKGRDPHDPRR